MRCVSARVLPVPAPASTQTGPVSVLATSRCSGSRASSTASADGATGGRSAAGLGGVIVDILPPGTDTPGALCTAARSVGARQLGCRPLLPPRGLVGCLCERRAGGSGAPVSVQAAQLAQTGLG